MSERIVKRSVSVAGHRTSVSLEEPFWDVLRLLAERRGISVQSLIGRIDAARAEQNLSSAIRVHVLNALQDALGRLGAEGAGEPR
jgi:predicted DNA-binding ribbon-helix-helix protein